MGESNHNPLLRSPVLNLLKNGKERERKNFDLNISGLVQGCQMVPKIPLGINFGGP
jgi:hypothetical protein